MLLGSFAPSEDAFRLLHQTSKGANPSSTLIPKQARFCDAILKPRLGEVASADETDFRP
jgi:hypothetical protein